jgi:muramoyltetrapeptide carboxypeptidase
MPARAVRPHAPIDVIAPAGPFDRAIFEKSLQELQSRGLQLRFRPDVFSRDRFLAGDDARRGAELHDALTNPDSDVIWCARGGYGTTRLLPHLPIELIRRANKILVGFSDITALHARWLAAGVPSIHGGMIARFSQEPDDVATRLLQLVRTGAPPAPLTGKPLTSGRAEGVLTGGNLMVLNSMLGTPYQPDFRGKIVLLEDVGERPYRIDRMLVQCTQAGLFEGVAGIALGEFTDCEERDGSSTSAQVLESQLAPLGVPIIFGLPCGHGSVNQAVPFGVRARLDAHEGTLSFLESIHAGAPAHVS